MFGVFICGLVGMTVALYSALVYAIRKGQRAGAVATVLVASPVMLAVFVIAIEGRSPLQFGLSALPLAVIVGDTVFVSLAVWTMADSYKELHQTGWSKTYWWAVLWFDIGFAVGTLFHAWDRGNYIAEGFGAHVNSPSKLFHDEATITVLFGGSFGMGLQVLRRGGWHRYVLIACFAAWCCLVAIDNVKGLNPAKLHPAWQW